MSARVFDSERTAQGRPRKRLYVRGPLQDRFWARIRKSEGEGCWEWTGTVTAFGYGNVNIGAGRYQMAHRLSWILTNGEPTPGLHVCHRCDNPRCVRPSHLFLGTQADNMRDMVAKHRDRNQATGRDCCGRGHPLVGENLYLKPNGVRVCRTCKNAAERKRWKRIRALARLNRRMA